MEANLSKAERTRQFIIETTAGIFNAKGYAGTSMSDITEATGLTKGSIYGNFENKEDVALAVFDYNISRLHNAVKQRMVHAVSYYDKLMVYARFYHNYSRISFMKNGCPILNTATEADDTNPKLKEKAAAAINRWKKNITGIIKAGIAAGEFKPGADVNSLALSVIALIEGGIMIAMVTDKKENFSETLKTVELLVRQLKK